MVDATRRTVNLSLSHFDFSFLQSPCTLIEPCSHDVDMYTHRPMVKLRVHLKLPKLFMISMVSQVFCWAILIT